MAEGNSSTALCYSSKPSPLERVGLSIFLPRGAWAWNLVHSLQQQWQYRNNLNFSAPGLRSVSDSSQMSHTGNPDAKSLRHRVLALRSGISELNGLWIQVCLLFFLSGQKKEVNYNMQCTGKEGTRKNQKKILLSLRSLLCCGQDAYNRKDVDTE